LRISQSKTTAAYQRTAICLPLFPPTSRIEAEPRQAMLGWLAAGGFQR